MILWRQNTAVFISYSHSDETIVEKIAAYLVKENIHIWIDRWQLNFGDSLIAKVQEAMTEASVLLIMLSKTAVESEWCKKELSVGLIRELEEKRVVVIPILLETCDIPLFLRDKYYADFRYDFDSAIRKLQDSLLRNVDVTLNKVQTDKYFIDFAIDNGLKEDQFYLNIDSISFSKESEYSILCTIDVTGNDKITSLYKRAADKRAEHIIVDELLKSMLSLDKDNQLRTFIPDNKPQWINLGLRDPRLGYEFRIRVYLRRMGINTGFNVLFDFGSIIRIINERREEILKSKA